MKQKPKRKPFFSFIKLIMRPFIKKVKIIKLFEDELDDASIYLCNHEGASGPLMLEFNFPKNFRFWGTFEMCGNYKTRFNYLYGPYFQGKKKNNKFCAFFKAVVVAFISGRFYKGLQLIPTFPDARTKNTITGSLKVLNTNQSIIIFPENSKDGYKENPTQYLGGFVLLANKYHKKTGKNIKIYNMYYSRKHNTLIIDKPCTYKELSKSNKNYHEIAEKMRIRAIELNKIIKQKKCKT